MSSTADELGEAVFLERLESLMKGPQPSAALAGYIEQALADPNLRDAEREAMEAFLEEQAYQVGERAGQTLSVLILPPADDPAWEGSFGEYVAEQAYHYDRVVHGDAPPVESPREGVVRWLSASAIRESWQTILGDRDLDRVVAPRVSREARRAQFDQFLAGVVSSLEKALPPDPVLQTHWSALREEDSPSAPCTP